MSPPGRCPGGCSCSPAKEHGGPVVPGHVGDPAWWGRHGTCGLTIEAFQPFALVSGDGALPTLLHGESGRGDISGCASVPQMNRALFVVVSGPPASGKSTLAPVLAGELRLPLIAKDTVKDALMSVLPVPDVEASRHLGQAAVAVMLAVATESPVGAVIESNFYRSVAGETIARLPGAIVEVFCRCDPSVAAERYRRRAGTRHAGHFNGVRTMEELWNDDVAEPVAGDWPLLEVDTNVPVDPSTVLAFVRRRMG